MLRSRLKCVKHITYALATLVLIACGVEIGLRVYDSYTRQFSALAVDDDVLVMKCLRTHHRLKPLRRLVGRHPDTQQPIALTTNSFGLRGDEIEVPKPPGVFRIVCLGDERTLAAAMAEPETFCARLQESLQQKTSLEVEVINAGVPGYCPLLSYLQVRHVLSSLQPDLLLLNFDMSDVADDHRCRRHTVIRNEVPLACPHPELASEARRPGPRWLDHLLLPDWCRKQWGQLTSDSDRPEDRRDIDAPEGRYAWLRDQPPDWGIYIEQTLSPIPLLAATAERLYGRFLVATYPAPWQASPTASDGMHVRRQVGVRRQTVYRSRYPFQTLSKYLSERGIPLLDASTEFQAAEAPDRLYLKNAAEFSADGHLLYAQLLDEYIVRNVTGIWHSRPQQPQPPMADRSYTDVRWR